MVEAVLRSRRRRANEKVALAAARYAARGWPVCLGARPSEDEPGRGVPGRACSCDRVGCPAPGAHPMSPAWQLQASTDPSVVARWWAGLPQATILLATGRTFDVLDVPAAAGTFALASMRAAGVRPGPVALGPQHRALFFVAARAAFATDDEWWSCHLDCEPEAVPAVTGLRWHCRDSYVVAPPSRLCRGLTARWVIEPGADEAADPLPDALRLIEYLADACEEIAP
jgi:bifunctional DNA primase/polymerase-like protein